MGLPAFDVEVVRDDARSAVVAVVGEVDLATASNLSAALADIRPTADKVVRLDLGQVSFLDSSGLSVLVESRQRFCDAGARLVLHRPSDQIVRVLEISGLDELFEVSRDAVPAGNDR